MSINIFSPNNRTLFSRVLGFVLLALLAVSSGRWGASGAAPIFPALKTPCWSRKGRIPSPVIRCTCLALLPGLV